MLAGAALVFGLLAAEVAIRLLQPQPLWIQAPGLYELDSEGGVKLRPGYRGESLNRVEYSTTVIVNSAGLRGAEIEARRPGELRVLTLGDSFTYGVGVENDEVFALHVAAALSQAWGRPVQGLNGGVPGMGVPQEVDWLERHGLRLEPDVVVLAVFAGNDLRDATMEWGGRGVVGGQLVNEGEVMGLRRWIYYNSHLFVLLKRGVPAPVQNAARALLGLGEPHSMQLARASFEIYSKEPNELVEDGVANTREALGRLVELSESHGFQVVALVIPDIVQVIDRRWEMALDQLGLDPQAVDREAPTRLLAGLLEEKGIPYVDLTPPLKQAEAEGREMYFRYDRHWTPEAHELAARHLADLLLASRSG